MHSLCQTGKITNLNLLREITELYQYLVWPLVRKFLGSLCHMSLYIPLLQASLYIDQPTHYIVFDGENQFIPYYILSFRTWN